MDKIRYGVIGLKGVGELHCLYAQQNERVELTALVDIDSDIVNKKSEELGVPGFTDYRDMLNRGMVDAVSIATPHHLHYNIGLDCLNAGVHIYVEKPIANLVSEAEKIIAVAKAKNLKICVGHQYRLFRSSQIVKQLIDTGALGNIRRVLWTWGVFRPESYYVRWPWKGTFRQAGTGLLGYHGSHDLDLICWMIGKPVQVSAFIGNQYHQAETEDFACANLLFASGAFASLQFTLNQPSGYSVRQIAGDRGIIVMPNVKSLTYDQRDEILLGTYQDGLPRMITQLTGAFDQPEVSWCSLQLSSDESILKQPIISNRNNGSNKSVLRKLMSPKRALRRLGLLKTYKQPHRHPIQKRPNRVSVLINSFIDAVINGEEPLVSGESTLPSLELVNAIVLSAMRKKTVELPIDREEYDQLFEELSSGKVQVPRYR